MGKKQVSREKYRFRRTYQERNVFKMTVIYTRKPGAGEQRTRENNSQRSRREAKQQRISPNQILISLPKISHPVILIRGFYQIREFKAHFSLFKYLKKKRKQQNLYSLF